MRQSSQSHSACRFGAFEVDLRARELRKGGLKIKLQEQPFQVLALLLERAGQVVTREELRQALWPSDTFVDFDQSLNTAVRKLREVLGDTASTPRFIETLPRNGYRFVAPLEAIGGKDPAREPKRKKQRRLVWVASFAVAVALGAIAAWYFWPKAPVPERVLSAIPLTSYPGEEKEPSFSPDGGQVAFAWNGDKEDNQDIYVKLIGGGPPLRLTTDPAEDYGPAWSPDGRHIAFVRRRRDSGDLFLIPANGGPERRLAGIQWYGLRIKLRDRQFPLVAWSPDSKWVAFANRDSPEQPYSLFLLSPETGEKRQLTSPPKKSVGDGGVAFSPDGRQLAFVRLMSSGYGHLYVLPLSEEFRPTGEPRRLPFNQPVNMTPAWTPDGREIVFAAGPAGSRLWRVKVSGSQGPQPLGLPGESASGPAVSRQGGRLVYVAGTSDLNIWRMELSGRSEPGPPVRLIASTKVDVAPQFSPDGKRIAFESDRTGNGEVWVCDGDGGNQAQMTSFGAHSGSPRWSPDGERIAFDSNKEGRWQIYVVDAAAGVARRLHDSPFDDDSPGWSHDGKWIYFASNRTGELQVWKMPAKGGEPVQVTRRGGFLAYESPDGKYLYYMKRFEPISEVWKVPVDCGEEIKVLDAVWRRGFAVTNQGIYFMTVPEAD
ncbi:MAG TPA: winged helix-turn-helix domain-containing protein, partial [Bryobacteraceae bacterium]|nr:winged helix-turn-helix domain-containing protein [Bryobacteraceae bacterium]